MAQAQVGAARFMTEVAPPPVVSVMRRRKVPWCLDTIAEDDRDQLLACGGSPLDHGFMTRDLGKYFSEAHGCLAGSWESGHRLGHRRAVPAQE